MGYLKKFFKKTFKGIKKALKPIGRALKRGLGDVGKFFGEMGPLGTLALTLMLPGIGAAWSSFGTWAGAQGGLLGGVMQSIAAVGNTAGKVYSSVTGMISDTVGNIAANTIGKIPVGANKNLADVYNGFTQYVGNRMDDIRMTLDLPTQNITADSVVADAGKLNEKIVERGYTDSASPMANLLEPDLASVELPEYDFQPSMEATKTLGKGYDDPISQKMRSFTDEDWKALDINPFKDDEFTFQELQKIDGYDKVVDVSVGDKGFEMTSPDDVRKALKDADAFAQGEQVDVITGFKRKEKYFGLDNEKLEFLEPEYTTVPKSILSEDELKLNTRLQSFADYNNNRIGSFEKFAGGEDALKNLNNDEISMKLNAFDAKKTYQGSATAWAGQEALDYVFNPEEQTGVGGGVYIQPIQTDASTFNDYTKNYGTQYRAQGFSGNTANLSSLYQAGFYGNDPFTLMQFYGGNNQSYGRIPQPTINI